MRNIYALANVHALVPASCFVTVPFDFALRTVSTSREILEDYLLGCKRGTVRASYAPADYLGEFADLLCQMEAIRVGQRWGS
jgi:hypothetical protein